MGTKALTEKEQIEFFKLKASPYFWRRKAEELKFAAEILWPHAEARLNRANELVKAKRTTDIRNLEPDTFSIVVALLGFSTEALFKGVIIRDNPSFVSNGILSRKITHHDLLKLAEVAKLPLSKNEKIFCKQAYRAMVESRYPISKKIEKPNYSYEIGGHFKTVFTELYQRLYPTLNN